MPNPYDMALRKRAVQAYESGEGSYATVAALFGLDQRTLERWVARWRATGTLTPKPRGGGWACPIALDVLEAVVRERPDGTVEEFCQTYNRRVRRAQQTNATSFRRAMRRQGFVVKKNARGRARSTGRTWQRSARRS